MHWFASLFKIICRKAILPADAARRGTDRGILGSDKTVSPYILLWKMAEKKLKQGGA